MGLPAFDFKPDPSIPPVNPRAVRGRRNYLAGLAAEDRVAARYQCCGHDLRAARWRGGQGEIDLIVNDGDGLIFIEVKKAATHDRAAEMLRPAQAARILATASEYLGTMPMGQMTPARIDVALVDGQERIEILENAIGH